MTQRTLTISVPGITLRGRCGVTPEERAIGQTLVVDVLLEPVSCPGAETDDLEGTVNYSRVVDLVRGIVEGGEFHLLERLATVIADALWARRRGSRRESACATCRAPPACPAR